VGELKPLKVPPEKVADYEAKWTDESRDFPICARCDEQIGSPEEDEAAEYMGADAERELPIRVWRPHPEEPDVKQELAFHKECAEKAGLI